MTEVAKPISNNRSADSLDPLGARAKLERAATIHWFHAVVVALSLLLTFFAWHYSKSENEARIRAQFDREAEHVVELIRERMQKYEDALWGGVALIHTHGGDVDFKRWQEYAESIDLEEKYPGINGIGVIHAMQEKEVPAYLAEQRKLRPDYTIHPPHEGKEYYPISYVIPEKGNEKAVGLDMAHETNRFTAAKLSRDTGLAQITGPITLVQDSEQTPGFLFYAPFYQDGTYTNINERQSHFRGMVYAPFVVKKLLAGTLEKEKRHIGLRITDGESKIYDEHVAAEADFDPEPLFESHRTISMYGRQWAFDIRSAKSFRAAASDSQPLTILFGGIAIDVLLCVLFFSNSRASNRALKYADSMTLQLEKIRDQIAQHAEQLEQSNAELEQFAYVASHDLQEPLRKISAFAQLLEEEYGERLDDSGHDYLNVITNGAQRLKTLVSDLLTFSRITTRGEELIATNTNLCVRAAIDDLELAIAESNAEVTCDELPTTLADQGQLTQLFQNLLGNAIKYRGDRTPRIHIACTEHLDEVEISVTDNGIGIDEKFHDRVFQIFQRLHNRREYSGTGIGLALCKRIVERFGGRIWLESTPGVGTTFFFTLNCAVQQDYSDDNDARRLQTVGAAAD